jgi:hypothetical protein
MQNTYNKVEITHNTEVHKCMYEASKYTLDHNIVLVGFHGEMGAFKLDFGRLAGWVSSRWCGWNDR